MCRLSANIRISEIERAKKEIREYLDDPKFETYVNELDVKNIYRYIYDRSDHKYETIFTINKCETIFATLIHMIIEDTGEQYFIDNVKLSNIDQLFRNLIFEDSLVFRRHKLIELDFQGAMFEGNVVFDCDCLASAFNFCVFCGDMIFTNNCKWCGAFKSIISQGKIIIPGGMLSIDPMNFIMLFKENTTYTGTKDEFLALVARSEIPASWVDQAKKIVKFSFSWKN